MTNPYSKPEGNGVADTGLESEKSRKVLAVWPLFVSGLVVVAISVSSGVNAFVDVLIVPSSTIKFPWPVELSPEEVSFNSTSVMSAGAVSVKASPMLLPG